MLLVLLYLQRFRYICRRVVNERGCLETGEDEESAQSVAIAEGDVGLAAIADHESAGGVDLAREGLDVLPHRRFRLPHHRPRTTRHLPDHRDHAPGAGSDEARVGGGDGWVAVGDDEGACLVLEVGGGLHELGVADVSVKAHNDAAHVVLQRHGSDDLRRVGCIAGERISLHKNGANGNSVDQSVQLQAYPDTEVTHSALAQFVSDA